mmetsp:Transcript_81187/g.238548  ORF Transcript_81187/g.238548 Transcript_81187/m.238548 type:complete len:250 (+) Transcript_81187:464-1213(+)
MALPAPWGQRSEDAPCCEAPTPTQLPPGASAPHPDVLPPSQAPPRSAPHGDPGPEVQHGAAPQARPRPRICQSHQHCPAQALPLLLPRACPPRAACRPPPRPPALRSPQLQAASPRPPAVRAPRWPPPLPTGPRFDGALPAPPPQRPPPLPTSPRFVGALPGPLRTQALQTRSLAATPQTRPPAKRPKQRKPLRLLQRTSRTLPLCRHIPRLCWQAFPPAHPLSVLRCTTLPPPLAAAPTACHQRTVAH